MSDPVATTAATEPETVADPLKIPVSVRRNATDDSERRWAPAQCERIPGTRFPAIGAQLVQPHVDETIAHQGTDLYAAKAGEVFECSPEGILLKDGKQVELDEKFAEVCSKAVEGAPLPEEIVKELGLPSGACWGVPSGQYYGGLMGPAPVMGSQMIPNYGMYPMQAMPMASYPVMSMPAPAAPAVQ